MTNQTSPVNVRPGSFEEAFANGLRLLDQDPASALKQAETLIRIRQDARVFRLAAEACRKLGMKADADGAELGAIQASMADPMVSQIAVAESEGRLADARSIAQRFLRNQPDDLLAQTLVAETSIKLWDLEPAEQLLGSVLERAPTFLRASMLLATCLTRQARLMDAIRILEEVTRRKPGNLPALTYMAQLRAEARDDLESTKILERLVQIDGDKADRWVSLAQSYRYLGRADEAKAALRQALARNPNHVAAWWHLANYYPTELKPEDEQKIRACLRASDNQVDLSTLHITLGLIEDRAGNLQDAFKHFIKGKRIRFAAQKYDPSLLSREVESISSKLTRDYFTRHRLAGYHDPSPVFLLGMHRSGSTMVERILARHSKIEGTGELPILIRLVEPLRYGAKTPEQYGEKLSSISAEELGAIGRRYIEGSADYRRTGKPFFIDKQNPNWIHIGLILSALPNARIIDVRRDPLDCCWANFKMIFSDAYPPANDLRSLGQYYRDYVRMFAAMQAAAPGRILTVRYEDVVDDIEGQTRRMLDFLGLDFEPDCLDFHLSTGSVATASSEQVRQPLNRRGIGSAKPYRQWLRPLAD